MPIKIYSCKDGAPEVAWLCDENWCLLEQADALEQWLRENRFTLKPGDYIADIGFSPREDAMGGGAAVSPESMRIMADLGITVFLSEYPAADSKLADHPILYPFDTSGGGAYNGTPETRELKTRI